MLKSTAGSPDTVTTHGFLLAVEMETSTDIEAVMNRLADGITMMEGVGSIDIEHLGAIDMFEEQGGADVVDPLTPVHEPIPAFVTSPMKES